MRLLYSLVLSIALAGTPHADECSLDNARYKQPDAAWWLTFVRVPQFAAPNQTAAFYIELPNSDVKLEGEVHVPNGFGAPLWSLDGPCRAGSIERCRFLEENQNPAIYGVYDGVVRFLEGGRGAKAPDQIILPQLSESLWYSRYRETEWADDLSPGDAFLLDGCD
jgi:hypothetical protein